MKILVATKETQGQRKNDFCFCKEGEFVRFGFDCDRDNGNIDGGCGCQRSVCGWDDHKATTTFKIVSTKMRKKSYLRLFIKSMVDSGWYKEPLTEQLKSEAQRSIKELLDLANHFRIGTVMERRGNNIQVRRLPMQLIISKK